MQNNFSNTNSSNLNASKYKSINTYNRKKILKKNIIISINENIFEKLNWEEFKDIIIEYSKKYFSEDENEEFGFV